MTTTTSRHGYITWPEGTTQPQVGYNDLVDKLDVEVGLSVISRTTDAQPASPTEGDAYLITGSATGAAWSTYSQHDIAIYRSSAWTAITPTVGQVVHVQDESDLVAVWNGTSWVTITSSTPLGKYDATVAPTATDDSGSGYSVGSLWCDVTNDLAYVCLDATSTAAVWTQIANTLNKLDGTTAPTANDDSGDGYAVGSLWIDVTNDNAYILVDATVAAAVWLQVNPERLNNYAGAAAPTANEDSGDGYGVGSFWFDTTNDKAYVCLDATAAAAVWTEITQGGGTFDGTKYVGVNDQTGTTYTLVLGDAGKLITMSNAAANTLTIPANSSVAFDVGTRIDVLQKGAGQTTVAITTDTLNAAGGTKINAQYEVVSLIKIAATTWVVVGGVA